MLSNNWDRKIEEELAEKWKEIENTLLTMPTIMKEYSSHISFGNSGCGENCVEHGYICPVMSASCSSHVSTHITLQSQNASVAIPIDIDTTGYFEGDITLPIDDEQQLVVPLALYFQYRDLLEALCARISLRNWLNKKQANLGGVSVANLLAVETKKLLKTMPYKEYLQTDHWKKLREAAYKAADKRCQVCNASDRPLHTHHRTYIDRGDEKASDLIVLCDECHNIFHQHGKLSY